MNNIKTNVLFFVLMALIFMAFVAISIFQPQDLIPWLIQHYGWSIEKKSILEQYIQEETWFRIKITLVFLFLFLIYLVIFDSYLIKEYKHAFSSFFHWIKKDFMDYPISERIILGMFLFFFALVIVWYSSSTPLQLDELHTWLFFVDKGPLVTAAYYPSSNNHIAYNLLSVGWNAIFSPLWAIRIVSMLSSIGVVILFFLMLRRRYNVLFSIAGMLLLMSSAPFLWYSIQGRGYVLELLVLTIILYILIQPAYDFVTDRLLVLFNAWAIYVVPLAIIPVALLNAYYAYRLVQEKEHERRRLVRVFVYSVVLVVLFYAPVIVFSGAKQLVNNPFVQRISYGETLTVGSLKYMPELWSFINGCDGFLSLSVLIIVTVGSILLVWNKNKFILWSIGMFVIPFLFLQCYPVLLYERTWLWLVIPFVCSLVEIASFFTDQSRKWQVIISLFFFMSIASANTFRSYETNQLLVDHATDFLKLKQCIDSQLKGKTLRVYNDVVYDYLLFDQRQSQGYTLLYGNQQPAWKADGLLMNYQGFKPSDGSILWTDLKDVLFVPK